jgi:hypothetical protein
MAAVHSTAAIFIFRARLGTNSFARKPSAVIGASPGKFGTVSRFSS